MREIKFRAWNTYSKEMIDWNDCCKTEKLTLSNLLNNQIPHLVPMQFIGIKDKYGEEIFEGDILIWRVNGIIRTACVYYDDLQCSFWMGKSKEGTGLVLNDWMRGEYEKIGNIHVHPELMIS